MLYLENHILVAHIACPPDNAYIADTEVLRILTKGLALRWGVYTGKQQKTQKG